MRYSDKLHSNFWSRDSLSNRTSLVNRAIILIKQQTISRTENLIIMKRHLQKTGFWNSFWRSKNKIIINQRRIIRQRTYKKNLMPKSKPSSNSKNCTKCKNWTKWPKCNSSVSKLNFFWAKIWLNNNNGKFFNNSVTIKPKSKCKINNIKWCYPKASTETTCKWSKINLNKLKTKKVTTVKGFKLKKTRKKPIPQ